MREPNTEEMTMSKFYAAVGGDLSDVLERLEDLRKARDTVKDSADAIGDSLDVVLDSLDGLCKAPSVRRTH